MRINDFLGKFGNISKQWIKQLTVYAQKQGAPKIWNKIEIFEKNVSFEKLSPNYPDRLT